MSTDAIILCSIVGVAFVTTCVLFYKICKCDKDIKEILRKLNNKED